MRQTLPLIALILSTHAEAGGDARRIFLIDGEIRDGNVVLAHPSVRLYESKTATVEVGADSAHLIYRWTVTATAEDPASSFISIISHIDVQYPDRQISWTVPPLRAKPGETLDASMPPGHAGEQLALRLRVDEVGAPSN